MLEARIDYAKWVIAGEYSLVMRKVAEIAQAFEYEQDHATFSKPSGLKSGDYHDGKRKCHVAWLEVYGPVSHNVMECLQVKYTEYLARLDWRVPVDYEQYTYSEVRRAMKARSNANNTFMEMDSRVRTKAEGRDSGGESLYSGAAGSDRRVVYYRRGNEKAAVECRFLHKKCQLVIGEARDRYMSLNKTSFMDCVTEALEHQSKLLFEERTGMSWDVTIGTEQRGEQHGAFVLQEVMLLEIDELFDRLDEEGKKAFLDAHIETADRLIAKIDNPVLSGMHYVLTDDSGLDE